jgi:hypothetical protein
MMNQAHLTNQQIPRSKLGIASFVIAIGTFVLASLAVVLAVALLDHSSRGMSGTLDDIFTYGLLIGAPAAHCIGLILGVVALFQKRRGKAFAVMGIILNILFPAGALLVIIGLLSIAPGVR